MMSRRFPFSALMLGAIALTAISCSEGTPLSPKAQSATADNSLLTPVTGLLQHVGLLSCTPMAPAWDSERIGPAGGTLHIGPHTFVVPAGALSQTVTITAYSPSDKVNHVDFQPEGLKFKKSASLTMSYANCNVLALLLPKHIAYVDDRLNILDILNSVDNLLTKKVTGQVDHFSDYAVAW